MAQPPTKKVKGPRGIYSLEDEEANWLRDRLVFKSKSECISWMESHVDDKEHPSNPVDPHLEHIFTFLTSWEQIESYLLLKMDEIDKLYPPTNIPTISKNNVYAAQSDVSFTDSNDSTQSSNLHPPAMVKSVLNGLKQRLNLPIHNRLNRQATMNTMSYLYHHMRCGIYVMIRQGKVRMFVPFVNAKYTNTWHDTFKWNSKFKQGGPSEGGEEGELSQDILGYYEEKRHLIGGRKENVIEDVKEWWVNGNIVCNEHCPPGQTHSQYWGDQLLVPLRDMFHHLCEKREVADCEFFINKRDYPHLKVHVHQKEQDEEAREEEEEGGGGVKVNALPVEPYGFVFERDDRDPLQDVALTRHKHTVYAPIASFYCGSPLRFADLPIPTSEDWEAATGLVFPPSFKREADKDGNLKFNNPRDLFTEDNFRKFDCAWSTKRDVAFFRGTATGGGITIHDNQRLKCASLSYEWEHPEASSSGGGGGEASGGGGGMNRKGMLDAAITGWNKRDKKIFGKQMSCLNPKDFKFTGGKHNFVPIYEQSAYKYLIYIDGHCAACRYAFMMRLGSVILKVESNGVADRMWYFPLLRPWYDHVPVNADLSDLDIKIQWCREHDKQCQIIAQNAKDLYNKYMNENGILDYLEVFCNEISTRFEYPPKWWQRSSQPTKPPNLFDKPSDVGKGLQQHQQHRGDRYCSNEKYCSRCEAEKAAIALKETEELQYKNAMSSILNNGSEGGSRNNAMKNGGSGQKRGKQHRYALKKKGPR